MKMLIKISLILVACFNLLCAEKVSRDSAILAVKGWLKSADGSFGQTRNNTVTDAESYKDSAGKNIFYKVDLGTNGFVVTSADDEYEPIIAFSNMSSGAIQKDDPLYAMLSKDPRCKALTTHSSATRSSSESKAKWAELINQGSTASTRTVYSSISDVRVAPLLKTKWGQGAVQGYYYYNHFTPNHYLTGCVATAMAQLMYYHKYPSYGIGHIPSLFTVDDKRYSYETQGGDGNGGVYAWNAMPENPNGTNVTLERVESISRLCFDAGMAVEMKYTQSASTATLQAANQALKSVFGYSNSQIATDGSLEDAYNIVCSNLDAKLPVIFGIIHDSASVGHAVICDGYGYISSGTIYHHLNMGWDGLDDLWYNLPNIDATNVEFNVVDSIIHNIYPSGSGGIVSGRVLDEAGRPIEGAMVSYSGGVTKTDSNGIYALAKVSAGTKTISASKVSYEDSSISKYLSVNSNIWGADIVLSGTPDLTPYQPNGWSDEIVLSTVTGTNTDSTVFYSDSKFYMDIAILNEGNGQSDDCSANLYLDNELLGPIPLTEISPGYYRYWEDANMTELEGLSFGWHSLKLIIDEDGDVDESNELNNEFTKTFYVSPRGLQGEIVSVSPNSFVGGKSQSVTVKIRSYNLGTDNNYFLDCVSLPSGWRVAVSSINSTLTDNGTIYSKIFSITPPITGGSGNIVWKFYDDGYGAHPSGSTLLDSYSQTVSATNSLPGTVSGLTASAGSIDGWVDLSWNSVSGATDYYIYYSENDSIPPMSPNDNGSPSSGSSVGTLTSKTITGLTPGQSYYFCVRAKNSYGYGNYSSVVSAVAKLSPPYAPTNLSARTGANEGEVNLSWAKSSKATSYKIFYEESSNGAPFYPSDNGSPLNGSDVGDVSSITVKYLDPGKKYYFSVKAVNSVGESSYASSVSAYVKKNPPAAPTLISATTGTNEGEVRLNWDASIGATSYSIYYDEDSSNASGFQPDVNGSPASGTNVGNVTSKLITGLTPGATYYFSVKAHSAYGDSPFATQKSAKVKINPFLAGDLSDKVSEYDDATFIYYFPKSVFVGDSSLTFSVSGLPGSVSPVCSSGDNWYFVWSSRDGGWFEVTITATDPNGSVASDTFHWTVNPGVPIIATGSATSVTDNAALISAKVLDWKGGELQWRGIELSKSRTDWSNRQQCMDLESSDSFTIDTSRFFNLERGTTYYYRAFISTRNLNYGLIDALGEVKSFTTTFTFDEDKMSQIETLKAELIAGGIANVLDENLELYRQLILEHVEYVESDAHFIQALVDGVNGSEDFIVVTLDAGWNLVSSPYENIDLKKMMSEKELSFTAFEYSDNCYQICGSAENNSYTLTPGRGYWVFAYEDTALVFSTTSSSTNRQVTDPDDPPTGSYPITLTEGWNLVGPLATTFIADLRKKYDSIKGHCWGWSSTRGCYKASDIMNLGSGYWIFCDK